MFATCFFIFIIKTFPQGISKGGVFSHILPRILWSPFSLYSRCEMFSLVLALISHVCSNYAQFSETPMILRLLLYHLLSILVTFSLIIFTLVSLFCRRELLEFVFPASILILIWWFLYFSFNSSFFLLSLVLLGF